MNKELIYLDYNATTPTDPRVVSTMLPYFTEMPGNAASRSHPFGWQAEEAVSKARAQIADLIHVQPKELVFASGATEADNLALKGVFQMYHRSGNHIITLKTEHPAVLDTCEQIERMGGKVTYLDVNPSGLIDLEVLENAITESTVLVSIMWANNEIGVIQPMQEIGKICKQKGVLLMSDATQAVGKIEVDPIKAGVHIMAFTAHKMYGPKGVGALFVNSNNPRVKLTAQIAGGGHENGMRSGTLNVPGIVGFGKAAEIAQREMVSDAQKIAKLRDRLEAELLKLEETFINGSLDQRLPNVSNLLFKYVDGDALMATFHQSIAASSGSACSSALLEASHVLIALGLHEDEAVCSVRFSLGKYTTAQEIETTLEKVKAGVKKLRNESPVWSLFKEGKL